MADDTPIQNQSYSDEYLRQLLAQHSGLNFVQRLNEPGLWGRLPADDEGPGKYKTHKMASSDNLIYPTVVWDPAGQSLVQLSGPEAYNYAIRNKQYIKARDDAMADYVATNYKRAFPQDWFKPW